MAQAVVAVVFGLALLVWSADRFVAGAAAVARHFGMPPLLIGMVIVGFGTSAPELVVSVIAALQGNPGIALGNAYGSNISNIALILGLTALLSPVVVAERVSRRELPLLVAVTGLAAWQLRDGLLSRVDGIGLLCVFALWMAWCVWHGLRGGGTEAAAIPDAPREEKTGSMSVGRAVFWLLAGLVLLVASSRILVWGAVEIARAFGVGDLIIGLTVVAVGTSLPELASSVIAARRGEHDIALGNVLGSNMFNTLAVVGLAAAIRPLEAGPEVLSRDIAIMAALTLFLFLPGLTRGRRIGRVAGAALVFSYLVYTAYLIRTAFGT